jgi:hypothetical protein
MLYSDDSPHTLQAMSMNMVTYTVMLYYAYILNPEKTKKILQATTDNYTYRLEYNLSVDNIDAESNEAYYPALPLSEFPKVIGFINDIVMVQAQSEMNTGSEDILVNRWGGEAGFLDFLYDEVGDIFTKFNIVVDEGMSEDVTGMYYSFKGLRDFLQYAYDNNAPYFIDWQ